ncbi:MAG: insulinase family protein [Gammaproteobacteria bacterium]|nr:insulinase family protein [Gammaproteobacteria bacterium]
MIFNNKKWWVGLCLLLLSNVALAVPKIEHWTLDNGVRVLFVRTTELPLMQLHIAFDAASSRDPEGKHGVALLTNSMLRQGAGSLNADQIASGFERLGAEYGDSAERDMAVIELRSLSDPKLLNPALDLLAQLLGQPSFPPEALERERARTLIGLQQQQQSPEVIADQTFMRLVYGNHPYAHDPLGTAESLRAISRADLAAHHARYYVGSNAWLAMVGNASVSEAKEIAKRALGRLPRGELAPPLPNVVSMDSRRQVVSFPAQQTHVRFGHVAISRDDPDFFPLVVGNYTLGGGGLVSRLADEVREKRGYSYSVYSYFQPMRVPGPFAIGLQTKNVQRDDAINVARQVLADFVEHGPTPAELESAKRHLTGSFPLRLDSNQKIAENLAYIGFYGLPLNYLDQYIAKIEAVTAEQIRAAFKRHVDLQRAITVVVGGNP